jgi:hypothetical protein
MIDEQNIIFISTARNIIFISTARRLLALGAVEPMIFIWILNLNSAVVDLVPLTDFHSCC